MIKRKEIVGLLIMAIPSFLHIYAYSVNSFVFLSWVFATISYFIGFKMLSE